MQKIADTLFIGKCTDMPLAMEGNYAVLLTCHPSSRCPSGTACHSELAKYLNQAGLPFLYIEMINQEIPHYQVQDFQKALDFIDQSIERGLEVIVFSQKGESRAASIALLWMAWRGRLISNSTFKAARLDFSRRYPNYVPWPGMVIFLNNEWDCFKRTGRYPQTRGNINSGTNAA